jgi:hypothetical protein
MKIKLLLVSSCVVLLSACFPLQTININAPFDAKQASIINQVGKNTIAGSALMKRNDGVAVTCAGEEVTLTYATEYANERIRAIYGNNIKGESINRNIGAFAPDVPEYKTYKKEITCNAQGFFTFKNVADGDYYVITTIKWNVGGYWQGGNLMRKVSVKGGETVEIVLAP